MKGQRFLEMRIAGIPAGLCDKIMVGVDHVASVLQKNGACSIRMADVDVWVDVVESYDQVVSALRYNGPDRVFVVRAERCAQCGTPGGDLGTREYWHCRVCGCSAIRVQETQP